MREIKFRAWDKKCKEMFPVHELEFDKISQLLETVIGYDDHDSDGWTRHGGHGNRYANGVRFDIMQFTGLYDMYANEVYESDVVKGHYWNAKGRNRIIGVVQYRGNQIVIAGVKQYEGIFVPVDPLCEVIGNIYENPELLEV